MVIADYLCPSGHIFERMTDTSKPKPWRKRCPSCRRLADWTVLPPSVSRNAQRFSPTVIYQRPDGAIVNPGRAKSLPPKDVADLARKGYVEKRLNNFLDYQKSMKSYADFLQHGYEKKREVDAQRRTAFHEEVRRRYEPTLRELNPRQRQHALEAFAKLRELPPDYYKSLRPGVYLSAFEMDSNNCKWNDKETGFRDRRE